MRAAVGVVIVSPDHKWVLLECAGSANNRLKMIGGGIKETETLEDATVRETLEETGLHIDGDRLEPLLTQVTEISGRLRTHTFFLYRANWDEVGHYSQDANQYRVVWTRIESAMKQRPMGKTAFYVAEIFPRVVRFAVKCLGVSLN